MFAVRTNKLSKVQPERETLSTAGTDGMATDLVQNRESLDHRTGEPLREIMASTTGLVRGAQVTPVEIYEGGDTNGTMQISYFWTQILRHQVKVWEMDQRRHLP